MHKTTRTWRPGLRLDPAREAYSAPQDSLASEEGLAATPGPKLPPLSARWASSGRPYGPRISAPESS